MKSMNSHPQLSTMRAALGQAELLRRKGHNWTRSPETNTISHDGYPGVRDDT